MRPVLFDVTLAGVRIAPHAYGTCMVAAWVAGVALGAYVAHRRGLPWKRVLGLLVASLAVGVLAARVFDLWIAWAYYAEDPSRILAADFSGFSLYGGLLGAGLVGFALARRLDVPVWRLADAIVPGIAAGVVLMRFGCLLNGCCFGLPTDLPWGVVYPAGSPVWVHQVGTGAGGLGGLFAGDVLPVHPTPVYEALAALVLAGLALALMRRLPDGAGFLVFAIGFTLFRLGNGFLRARQPVVTAPEWFYPAFYAALAVLFAWLLVRRLRAGGPPPLPPEGA